MKWKGMHWQSLKTRVTLLTLAIFLISVWLLAFFAARLLREELQRATGEQQFSTVSIIAAGVNEELKMRLAMLESVAAAIDPARIGDPAAMQDFLDQRHGLRLQFNAGFFVLDKEGTALAEYPRSTGRVGVNYMAQPHVAAAFKAGKSMVSRPTIGRVLNAPTFTMAAPIRDARGNLIGAIAGTTSLGKPNFLDKFAESRYGKTGAYLLIAPQYRLIVTASDKHRIMEEMHPAGKDAMMDRVASGFEGSGVNLNSSGVEELVSAKAIPVAGWYLVSALPTEDIFAPFRDVRQRMLQAAGVFTLLAGALAWWMLRRQLQPMIAAVETMEAQASAGRPPKALPVVRPDEVGHLIGGFNRLLESLSEREKALSESEEKFRSLAESSPDFIMRYDRDCRHLYMNPAGLKIYGKTVAEIIGKSHQESGFPEEQCRFWEEKIRHVFTTAEPTQMEFDRQSAEGPVSLDWRLTPEFGEDGQVHSVLGVSRDITARRRTEVTLSFLAQLGNEKPGKPFFPALAEFLAGNLGMDFVCIDRLEGDGLTASTLAVWSDGHFEDNVSYALKDTPCGDVVGQAVCCFPAGVASLFARDQVLQDLRAESYVGVTLFDHTGRPIGLIAVIGRQPLVNRTHAEATMKMVALRAAGELERLVAEEALRFARDSIEHASEAIFWTDLDAHIVDVNDAACQRLGYSRAELLNMVIEEINPNFSPQTWIAHLAEIRRAGSRKFESVQRTQDGRLIPVEIVANLARFGCEERHCAFVRDITERKLAEAEIRRTALMVDAAPNSITVHDFDGNFLYANKRTLTLHGYSEAEFLALNLHDLDAPIDQSLIPARMQELRERGEATFEVTHFHKNGNTIPLEVAVKSIDWGGGKAILSIATDITERKLAEAVQRESDQRLAAIVDSALDAVISSNSAGIVTTWNEQAESIFGWTKQEAIGKSLSDLIVPPQFREAHRRGMERYLSCGEHVVLGKRFEINALRKNGQEFPVELSITPVRIANTVSFNAFLRDISEQEQAEATRLSLEAQLRQSQKMQAIGTLAGGIAHDFNNVLATILGNVDLAREDANTNPLALESLGEIRKAGERARALVQQILSFSRRQPTERKLTNLAPIVEESARLLRATLPPRLSIEIRCDADVPPVLADAMQIQQVLLNLVTNAMQAIRDGNGLVSIALDTVMLDEEIADDHPVLREMFMQGPGRMARLTVTDNGPGMDAAMLPRIFEPFFTTKAVNEGTGLGLSVVHGIVQAHDGAIEVDSAPGKGAAFTIYVPGDPSANMSKETAAMPAQPIVPNAGPSHREALSHIVYLDDDEALLFLVERLMARRGIRVSGFKVQHDAIAAIRLNPAGIDLVVTDFNMPGMSGIDVAHALRLSNPGLPVAIASGFVDETLQALADVAGVHELIFKANAVEDLCDAFARLVGEIVGRQNHR